MTELPFATIDSPVDTPRYTPKWQAERAAVLSRAARLGTCPCCRAAVLRGYDHDWAAFTATADPAPVTAAGELRALTEGLRSYDLVGNDLYVRDPHHVALRPAGIGRYSVLVEHRCNRPIPTLPPQPVIRRTRKAEQQTTPPF